MEMLHENLVKFFVKRFSHLKHERMVIDATIQYSPSSHTEQKYTTSSMVDRVKEFLGKGVSDSLWAENYPVAPTYRKFGALASKA